MFGSSAYPQQGSTAYQRMKDAGIVQSNIAVIPNRHAITLLVKVVFENEKDRVA